MHHVHTVKGRPTAVIQIADTGVSVVLWTMSAVCIQRGTIWNYSSIEWSLEYATRIIIDLFSVKLYSIITFKKAILVGFKKMYLDKVILIYCL